jgi:hypothetical protein
MRVSIEIFCLPAEDASFRWFDLVLDIFVIRLKGETSEVKLCAIGKVYPGAQIGR